MGIIFFSSPVPDDSELSHELISGIISGHFHN